MISLSDYSGIPTKKYLVTFSSPLTLSSLSALLSLFSDFGMSSRITKLNMGGVMLVGVLYLLES